MKKILLSLSAFTLAFTLNAQVCTPTWSLPGYGIAPDSATGLPAGTVGVPYSAQINFKVIKDTMYLGNPVQIHHAQINSVVGMPASGSLTYACNPSNCHFMGDSVGCVMISGTPVIADTGVHNLDITVEVFIAGGLISAGTYHVTFYHIDITNPSGVPILSAHNFEVTEAQPNPTTSVSQIGYYLPTNGELNFSLFNIVGSKVRSQVIKGQPGAHVYELNRTGLPSGIYFYRFEFDGTEITKRIVIK